MQIRNATIKSTMLGYEDHQILTCSLYLDYGDSEQGFGGYALDTYDAEQKERIATIYAGMWLKRILEVVGVTKWEDLPGKHIRAKMDDGRIHAIGNFIKEDWFVPVEEIK